MVAATERGICMTALGDDRAGLEAELRRRFPAAVTAARRRRAVRLGPSGSCASSPGRATSSTCRSTSAAPPFRRGCGMPCRRSAGPDRDLHRHRRRARPAEGGARAVAQACASNRLAVVVPCHRVVRRDGDLRWLSLGCRTQARAARPRTRRGGPRPLGGCGCRVRAAGRSC